ncbi:WD40 domain containing protein [Trichuris trichiura]|uniref:WD40 domain containing protein n=1 Tax=Trichuris trichiura TaxID=36087 RepID=A0A077YX01_TRITR|nr:WD40 domain containing protein [Trichuris trichiura]
MFKEEEYEQRRKESAATEEESFDIVCLQSFPAAEESQINKRRARKRKEKKNIRSDPFNDLKAEEAAIEKIKERFLRPQYERAAIRKRRRPVKEPIVVVHNDNLASTKIYNTAAHDKSISAMKGLNARYFMKPSMLAELIPMPDICALCQEPAGYENLGFLCGPYYIAIASSRHWPPFLHENLKPHDQSMIYEAGLKFHIRCIATAPDLERVDKFIIGIQEQMPKYWIQQNVKQSMQVIAHADSDDATNVTCASVLEQLSIATAMIVAKFIISRVQFPQRLSSLALKTKFSFSFNNNRSFARIYNGFPCTKRASSLSFRTYLAIAIGDAFTCSQEVEMSQLRLMVGSKVEESNGSSIVDYEVAVPKIQLRPDFSDMKLSKYFSENTSAAFTKRFTILHNGDVNRCRYMPQCSDAIATQSSTGIIYLFDKNRLPSLITVFDSPTPSLRLNGQEKAGFGLSWNALRTGHLLSSSQNGCVYHWNVTAVNRTEKGAMNSIRRFKCHIGSANDVAWSNHVAQLFATVGSDRKLCLWDFNNPDRSKPAVSVVCHDKDANCVAFNKLNPVLLATGSSDKTAAIWDIRKMKEKLSSISTPDGQVTRIEWSPHNELVFSTGHSDGHVNIWNIGKPFCSEANAGAHFPTQLMFAYDGHQGEVTGISWHHKLPFLIASTSNDEYVHIWQMSLLAYKDVLPGSKLLTNLKG